MDPANSSAFIALVKKYLQGKTTAAEETFLWEYYHYFDKEPDVLAAFSPAEKEQLENELKAGILEKIATMENSGPHKGAIYRRMFIRIAVAAVIAVLAGSLVVLKWMTIMNFIDPQQLTQKTTANGETTKIALSDGTVVWLNAGSKLVYPVVFKRGTRQVELEGEAYFEVAQHSERPFTVKAAGLATRVLGTSFNVNAYDNEVVATVTVLTGRVKVSSEEDTATATLLNPGQKLLYNKQQQSFKQEALETATDDIAWKEGKLLFRDAPLTTVAQLLLRRYAITLEVPAEMESLTIYADLQDRQPEEAVKSIAKILKVGYKKAGNTYTLFSKNR